jgi:hypothetical protein
MSNTTKQNVRARRNQKMQRIALRFLSNIYMSSEHEQLQVRGNYNSVDAEQKTGILQRLPSVEEYLREHQDATELQQHEQTNAIRIGGKKYQYTRRPIATTTDNSIKSIKRHDEQLSQWKSNALSSGLHRGRLFLSSQSSYPVLCFSVLNYDCEREKAAKRKREVLKLASEKGHGATPTIGTRGKHGVSFAGLFVNRLKNVDLPTDRERKSNMASTTTNDLTQLITASSSTSITSSITTTTTTTTTTSDKPSAGTQIGSVDQYDPNYLDDGTIKQGKSRLITSGPAYRNSFLPYVKRKNLKDEINAQFAELHPWLPKSMSLSKLRTLKRESLEQWKKYDLDMSTLALGIVYFERLVIKSLVYKINRKLKFAACLLLAFKFNEGEFGESAPLPPDDVEVFVDVNIGNTKITVNGAEERLQYTLNAIESALSVTRKQIFAVELQVFAELDFDLKIPTDKLMPHFLRLLDTLELSLLEYVGGKRLRMLGFEVEEEEEEEKEKEEAENEEGVKIMMTSDDNGGSYMCF